MRNPAQRSIRKAARVALACVLACGMASAVLITAGCSSATQSINQQPSSGVPDDVGLAPIQKVTSDDPLLAFAANSSTAVLNGPEANGSFDGPDSFAEKNFCFSPVSLYLACTLLGAGTQGPAQEQLLDLLGMEDGSALKTESEQLRQQLEETYGDAIIQVADSIWAGEGYEFTDAYIQAVEALGGGAFEAKFGTDEANRQISSWISDQTKGLLKPQISTELGQAALLINTIYFKDAWASQFDAANNEVAPFEAPGFDVQANYMRQEIADSSYTTGNGFTAARLSFSGGSTMTFVRANDDTRLYTLFDSAQKMQDLLSLDMDLATVDWWMPKFTVESSMKDLAKTMQALGVTNVFTGDDPQAFAPMLATDEGTGFRVSEIMQDTHLALDEDGVEAAAFTAIGVEKMALLPETEPVEFKLDRPFLYYVTSSDGVILFVGVMYNPNL